MAVPYIPLGMTAGIGALVWLFGRGADEEKGIGPEVTPVPLPPNRVWGPGTPVAVVAVDPSDPGLQGRAPGVRLRSEPTTKGGNATIVNQGVPNGQLLAVLSGETTDEQNRKWRRVATLMGQTAFAPFIGPDGRQNMKNDARYPTPWPTSDIPTPTPVVAGLPYDLMGACGGGVGCGPVTGQWPFPYPYPYPYGYGFGYPFGLGAGALRTEIVGACPPPEENGVAEVVDEMGALAQGVCTGPCLIYKRFETGGPGWTVAHTLPAGTVVTVAPAVPGLGRGPGADFVLVQSRFGWGWTRAANLSMTAPRTLGRRIPAAGPYVPMTLR